MFWARASSSSLRSRTAAVLNKLEPTHALKRGNHMSIVSARAMRGRGSSSSPLLTSFQMLLSSKITQHSVPKSQ